MSAKPTEATAAELLPSSLPKIRRGGIYRRGVMWVAMFCLNCGAESPQRVPDTIGSDAYFICLDCAPKWQAQFDTLLVEDEVFWELCKQEQIAHEGRVLTREETEQALKQPDHYLSKLVRSHT